VLDVLRPPSMSHRAVSLGVDLPKWSQTVLARKRTAERGPKCNVSSVGQDVLHAAWGKQHPLRPEDVRRSEVVLAGVNESDPCVGLPIPKHLKRGIVRGIALAQPPTAGPVSRRLHPTPPSGRP